MLIVEDDPDVARTELEVARERGFKGIVALRGDSGLALAHEYKPDAIILDMKLPVMDGWTVLDHLKHHPATRHIPVHIVSAGDGRQNALKAGAVAFVEKPISKEVLEETFGEIRSFIDRELKRVLVIEDDEAQRNAVIELIGGGDDVEVSAAGSGEEALEALELQRYDCMVLDLKLPEMGGFALLEKLKEDPRYSSIPVIVYTGKELTRREETKLKKFAESIVVKDASSPERLLDETSLFLHRVEGKLPQEKRRMLEQLHSAEEVFNHKKILIVDDDVRNVFALTSVLESHGMEVMYAENGERRHRPPTTSSRDRPRPDGHHDAGDGRLRDDAGDPLGGGLQTAPDHLLDRQGDEGRPREVDRLGRLGLHHEARRYRSAAFPDASLAVQVVHVFRGGFPRTGGYE